MLSDLYRLCVDELLINIIYRLQWVYQSMCAVNYNIFVRHYVLPLPITSELQLQDYNPQDDRHDELWPNQCMTYVGVWLSIGLTMNITLNRHRKNVILIRYMLYAIETTSLNYIVGMLWKRRFTLCDDLETTGCMMVVEGWSVIGWIIVIRQASFHNV